MYVYRHIHLFCISIVHVCVSECVYAVCMHSAFCCLIYGVLFRDPKRVMEETVFIPYRVFLYVHW